MESRNYAYGSGICILLWATAGGKAAIGQGSFLWPWAFKCPVRVGQPSPLGLAGPPRPPWAGLMTAEGPGASDTNVPSLCLHFCSLGHLHPHNVRPSPDLQGKGRLLPHSILMTNHNSCHLPSGYRVPGTVSYIHYPQSTHHPQGIVQRKKSRLGEGNSLAQGRMPTTRSAAILRSQS